MDFGFLKVCTPKEIEGIREGRKAAITQEASQTVKKILAGIREKGEDAIVKYVTRFDGYHPESFAQIKISEQEIESAASFVENKYPKLLRSIEACIENLDFYHQEELKRACRTWFAQPKKGKKIGQLVNPVKRAGVYAPGGRYPYPSSLIMAAVPAKIAGVREIAACSPMKRDSDAGKVFLYVCKRLGIHEVYNLGGAQAIGLFAYGTKSFRKVDKIVGPGNIYVTAAKKEVFGMVGIDSLAGPSEIIVISDETGDKDFIAADLISQAEHDPEAFIMLLTTSSQLAQGVIDSIKEQMQSLDKKYKENARVAYTALKNNCLIATGKSISELASISDSSAPEHLEIICRDPQELLKLIQNAGAVFVGGYTPVALGDYIGGTNHVIPTSGNARFSSPLGVNDFLKRSSVLFYDKEVLSQEKEHVERFSDFENLHAHKRSIQIRFGEEDENKKMDNGPA